MALLRDLRLGGRVRDHALDWDPHASRWRVEIRLGRWRVWNWVDSHEKAVEQRQLAEAQR